MTGSEIDAVIVNTMARETQKIEGRARRRSTEENVTRFAARLES
jgi:hypothetical protein